MQTKIIQRNIPPERENKNDSFRVKYNNRKTFDKLQVKITRVANGEEQLFEFDSSALPDKDSINFSTKVEGNKLIVKWRGLESVNSTATPTKTSKQVINKTVTSTKRGNGKIAFAPIADKKSKVLIIGTMPGERSLALQQYYGHAGNHFWKIVHSILNKPYTNDYEAKKKLLLDNGIALWDVLQYCESEGSADSDIANEKPNDFEKFFGDHPNIKHIFFASKKAQDFFERYVGKKNNFSYGILPSPSSANTWKTFDDKVNEWKVLLKHIGNG